MYSTYLYLFCLWKIPGILFRYLIISKFFETNPRLKNIAVFKNVKCISINETWFRFEINDQTRGIKATGISMKFLSQIQRYSRTLSGARLSLSREARNPAVRHVRRDKSSTEGRHVQVKRQIHPAAVHYQRQLLQSGGQWSRRRRDR